MDTNYTDVGQTLHNTNHHRMSIDIKSKTMIIDNNQDQ